MFSPLGNTVTLDKQTVLLRKVRMLADESGETFWDMFSEEKNRKMRIFFLNLNPSEQYILICLATVDALLSAD